MFSGLHECMSHFLENTSSLLSTQFRQFTPICNPSSRGSATLFWTLQYLHTYVYAPTDSHMYTYIKINYKIRTRKDTPGHSLGALKCQGKSLYSVVLYPVSQLRSHCSSWDLSTYLTIKKQNNRMRKMQRMINLISNF